MTTSFVVIELLFMAVCAVAFTSKRLGAKDPFSPLFGVTGLYLLYYDVRGFDIFTGTPTIFGEVFDTDDGKRRVILALILALTSFVFVLIGFVTCSRRTRLSRRTEPGQVLSQSRALTLHVAVTLASIVASLWLVIRAGVSPLEYIANLNYYRLAVNNDVAYIKFIINLSTISGPIYFVTAAGGKGRTRALLLAAPIILNLLFAHRYAAVYCGISYLIIRHYAGRPVPFLKLTIFAVAAVVANGIFATWRDFRYVHPDEAVSVQEIAETYSDRSSIIDTLLLHTYKSDLHGVDSVIRTRRAIDEANIPNHYGVKFLLEPLVGAIPYSLWPSKPAPLAVSFNNIINGRDENYFDPDVPSGGVVPTIVGDGYWAGGWLGVIAVSFVYGAFMACLGRLRRSSATAELCTYAVLLPYAMGFVSAVGVAITKLTYFGLAASAMNWYVVGRAVGERLAKSHKTPAVTLVGM